MTAPNATPRPRSGAFPVTPGTLQQRRTRAAPASSTPGSGGSSTLAGSSPEPLAKFPGANNTTSAASSVASRTAGGRSPLPQAPVAAKAGGDDGSPSTTPRIPTQWVEAHTQRMYVLAVYGLIVAYRLYDWLQVVEYEANPFLAFLKGALIDVVFLFGLPELRIPWLELSTQLVMALFVAHCLVSYMLMFSVPVPWQAWLLGVAKMIYDRGELSISEHNVRLDSLLHNSSLIMGKQIINILPEGSAVLNPENLPFCLGGDIGSVSLPLYFNATVPDEVELVRVDLDSEHEETIRLGRSNLKEIAKRVKRSSEDESADVVRFDYAVKKTGLYRLAKVLDEYKLEVQRRTADTLVVHCPRARVASPASDSRCFGDLSDLSLEVDGTPPLKIVYSRTINGKDHSFHFQSLQPDAFSSPLLGSQRPASTVRPGEDDISWARSQRVTVGLNESMNNAGAWQYSIDEVHDSFGNVVKYSHPADDPDMKPKPKHLVHNFVVKERPRVGFRGCDSSRNPKKVARGKAVNLPVDLRFPGRAPLDTSHTLTWHFSPMDTLTKTYEHGDVVVTESFSARSLRDLPVVHRPGLYTLRSVSSGSCDGEVQEPSSCLLVNPPEPTVALRREDIPDKCAGNSIGLRVSMDLVGTPPFVLRYNVYGAGGNLVGRERVDVFGLRHQMDLTPRKAGHYKYVFVSLDDAVYHHQQLSGPDMTLEQNVKPAASARIESSPRVDTCLEDEAEVVVALLGDAPFALEWEVIHDGKRKRERAADIAEPRYTIRTAPLAQGGEYTLALTSVADKSGCRTFLKGEAKISVRQRPRASFGAVDGKNKVTVVEGALASLPLRFHGSPPWSLSYRNLAGDKDAVVTRSFASANDALKVMSPGTYEMVDVADSQCVGSVDPASNTFEVGWFPRPELSLVESEDITKTDTTYVKKDVCEGDVDGFVIGLKGSPPYHVEYEVRHKPAQGSGSIQRRDFDAALGKASIAMDTSRAGLYTYRFSGLADNLYARDANSKAKTASAAAPLVLEQRVNAKPSASFAKPGSSFKYCRSGSGADDEGIPITLVGMPPFNVEVEIKHQGGGAHPELYRIPYIATNSHAIHIPREYLKLGVQHVRIRKVRDARGCQAKSSDQPAGAGGSAVAPGGALSGAASGSLAAAGVVQVHLFDAPAMYPLEARTDYCVGDHVAFTLSGTPPFEVAYTFAGQTRRAKSASTNFRRVAESPGVFAVTSVADRASECRAAVNLTKTIHPLPSVRISRGRQQSVDIHEGGEVQILFEFWGTPPFEFTYTRSSNAKKGQRSVVLETRHDVSNEHEKVVVASQEGTYEVVAIRDAFCSFSTVGGAGSAAAAAPQQLQHGDKKLLQ